MTGGDERLARLDRNRVEQDSATEAGIAEDLFDEVELAHRDAAGEEEDVGFEALFDPGAELVRVVLRDAE